MPSASDGSARSAATRGRRTSSSFLRRTSSLRRKSGAVGDSWVSGSDDLGAGPFQLWPAAEDSTANTSPELVGVPLVRVPTGHRSLHKVCRFRTIAQQAVRFVCGRRPRWKGDYSILRLRERTARAPQLARLHFYPEHTTGNDVALFDDGSLVATNFLPEGAGEIGDRYRLRGSLGLDTGDVLSWSSDAGWTHVANTNGAMPNGIIASRDESTFYFADAGNWRVAIEPARNAALQDVRVRVGGAPDNAHVDAHW